MPRFDHEKFKFFIFSLIGVFNTLFDIALYTVLFNILQSFVIANIASTSAALVGSYFLNSKITFKSRHWTKKSFIGFIVVTVFGLWVLQTLAIYIINHFFVHIPESFWMHFGILQKTLKTAIPKLLATAVTFIWNYLWYSRVIFKESSDPTNVIRALDEL